MDLKDEFSDSEDNLGPDDDIPTGKDGEIIDRHDDVGKDGEIIESYDKHELIVPDTAGVAEPYEGMEFDNEDSARDFYYAYATHAGFRVRVSRCQRSMRDGSIICRRFVCSREGFCLHKNPGSAKRQRATTRVGCMAMLLVKKQSPPGKWVVTKFVKDHNHEQPEAGRRLDLKLCTVVKARKLEEDNIDEKEDSPVEDQFVGSLPRGNPDLQPCEGMQFQSEESARAFYYAYANDVGFTVRISKCRRARDGAIICRRFVCSKEGYYVRKFGRTKRSRALTRVGCLARLIVKRLDSGIWVIANFEKEHNHPPFVAGQELSYQPPKPTTHNIPHGARDRLPASSESLPNWIDTDLQNSEISVTWRFNRLQQEGIRFAEEGATSVEIFNVAMLALREATQKVVAAKNNAVSGGSRGVSTTNQTNLTQVNSSGNQATPANLVLFGSGLSSQVPSAIKLPNGQAGLDNQQINISVPVAVEKEMSPADNSLDENSSFSSGMSEGRKNKYKMTVDDMEHLIDVQDYTEGYSKQNGVETQTQGWNMIGMERPGSNTRSGGNSSSNIVAIEASFNVSTNGGTSSSGFPVKVVQMASRDELLEEGESSNSKGCPVVVECCPPHPYCESLEVSPCCYREKEAPPLPPKTTPPVSGPISLVHAAAIKAGARIAPPSVAASLIKAVQSINAVRNRSGGGSPSAAAPRRVQQSVLTRTTLASGEGAAGFHHNTNNVHYCFSTEEEEGPQLMPPLVSTRGGGIALELGPRHVPSSAMEEYGGMESSLASVEVVQRAVSNASGLEDDRTMMMYHCVDLADEAAEVEEED